MKTILKIAITIALIYGNFTSFGQTAPSHHVVMQLSSSDTLEWKGAISNLVNLKKGWGDDVEIELVAHGPGIGFLLSNQTTQLKTISALKAAGVIFSICENTLKSKNIDHGLIIPEATTVPMGVGEIILKQEAGWSYIKAGF